MNEKIDSFDAVIQQHCIEGLGTIKINVASDHLPINKDNDKEIENMLSEPCTDLISDVSSMWRLTTLPIDKDNDKERD